MIFLRNCPDHPAGISDRNGIVGDVFYHNTPAADHNITPDRNAGRDRNIGANSYIAANGNGAGIFQPSVSTLKINGMSGGHVCPCQATLITPECRHDAEGSFRSAKQLMQDPFLFRRVRWAQQVVLMAQTLRKSSLPKKVPAVICVIQHLFLHFLFFGYGLQTPFLTLPHKNFRIS